MADLDVVLPWRDDPAARLDVVVRERPPVECQLDAPSLAWLEHDLLERAEFPGRPTYRPRRRRDVDLHDVAARSAAGVADRDGRQRGVVARDRHLKSVGHEGGEAQAVAEGIPHRPLDGLVVAVADHHPLAVAGSARLAGEGQVARGVPQTQWDGLCQMTGRIDHSEEDVGERGATGL